MPSHFSIIGMPIQNQEELLGPANRVPEFCSFFRVTNGSDLQWSSPSGAELWIQEDNHNRLIGINPHFAGRSRMAVALTEKISRPRDSALDGAFHAWADPLGTEPKSGVYPFVFDAPDFYKHAKLALPAKVRVQMAAFAYEVSLFDSEEAFYNSQTSELKFAFQSFLPAGTFSTAGETEVPQESLAIFTGFIQQVTLGSNELTSVEFWWLVVDSLCGSIDVVIDPELHDSRPKVGGILTGSFSLSGRVQNE